MYSLELITPPTEEPITTAQLKAHLRLNTSTEDSLIAGFITAARMLFESATDRQLVNATWRLHMDKFPAVIRLPLSPAVSVTSVNYTNSLNEMVLLDPSQYIVETAFSPATISPIICFPYLVEPTTGYRCITHVLVEFVAGYGAATDVPQLIKQAILLLASHYFGQREAWVLKGRGDPGLLTLVPAGWNAIVSQYAVNWEGDPNRVVPWRDQMTFDGIIMDRGMGW